MWGFIKVFKYGMKSPLFCFTLSRGGWPDSVALTRPRAQSRVGSMCSLQGTHGSKSLTKTLRSLWKLLREPSNFLCNWGRKFPFSWGIVYKKKRHWLFPEEKCIFHLSEGERWGDILGQGNVKSIWVRVLCLYNYLIFCPKYNLPVRWEVVSQPS